MISTLHFWTVSISLSTSTVRQLSSVPCSNIWVLNDQNDHNIIYKMYSIMSPSSLFVVYPPLVASVTVTREKHHIAGGVWPPIQTNIIVPDLSYSCSRMLCEAMKHVFIPPDLISASTAGSRQGSCIVCSAAPGRACAPCPSSCPWARWDSGPPPHCAHCPGARPGSARTAPGTRCPGTTGNWKHYRLYVAQICL